MPVAGMTTPLRSGTFKKLILNAGALLHNFDPSSYATVETLKAALATALADPTKNLGATRGGGTFNVAREMRQVEADGVRYRFVGDTFVDSADAYIATTLLELGSPEVMQRSLGTATVTTSGAKTLMKMRTRIADEDYLQNLCWVGDIADGGLAVIHLLNAINTTDLTITFTDKGEATLPVEFHAFQSTVEDYDYAPFELIYIAQNDLLASMTVNSAQGTNSGATKLTISGYTPGSGESYVYKAADGTAPAVEYGDVPDYTWAAWNGSADLTITNGYKVTVASINSESKVVAAGSATVVAKP